MFEAFIQTPDKINRTAQISRKTWIWRFWFLALMAVTVGLGVLLWRSGTPSSMIALIFLLIGAGIFAVVAITIIVQPRYGLYLAVFLTLVGDFRLTPWYPFTKNLSSAESLLFVHDALIISPLEVFLVLLILVWIGRGALERRLKFIRGPLFWPVMVFTGFIAFGLFWGLARGGDLNIALWESRAIFYVPVMLILASNLLEKPEHYNILIWSALAAVFVESLIGAHYYFFVLNRKLWLVDRIAAHAAAIHFNTFFVFLAAAWIFGASRMKRLSLLICLPFVALTFLAMQRRAGFLTLGIAFICLAIILFRENRRLFFAVVPFITVCGLVYTSIYWNSTGALGLPAQAVKSVIASDTSNAADQASNIYRVLENTNIGFTIHQEPLTGIGFGRPFYIIAPMPDISSFVFWEYITHNSIVWIWMKAGLGGFFSMLLVIGGSIMTGLNVLRRVSDPDLKTILVTAILYIVMHFTYAYVDMSWDIESMLYVGGMIGLINGLSLIYPASQQENIGVILDTKSRMIINKPL